MSRLIIDNLKGQGFHTNPERINKEGQPRKLVSTLKNIGYTKAEAANTINSMLAMTIDELAEIYKTGNILERTIAGALKKSLEKGSLYSLDTLLSRTHGKPTEMLEMSADVNHTLTVNFGHNSTIQSASGTVASTEQ
jgi:hypothetical protein